MFSEIDLLKREHLQESFKKVIIPLQLGIIENVNFFFQINPEQTLPTLDDNGNIIWDSHAICAYLVDKYANNDQLYPKDLVLRAKCNQRMFFDVGSLFVRLRDTTKPVVLQGASEVSQDQVDIIYTAFDILESFLATDLYLVGNNWTIADISVANTVFLLEFHAPLKPDKHSKIIAWLKRVNENVPYFKEINEIKIVEWKGLIGGIKEMNKLKL